MSIGAAVREARKARAYSQDNIASIVNYSRQLIQAVERERRDLPKEAQPAICRMLDDIRLYKEAQFEATGVNIAPYLDGIDEHPLVITSLFQQQLQKMSDVITQKILPIILQRPRPLAPEEKEDFKEALLTICAVQTTAENTLARLAKQYDISLAEIWDMYQERLVKDELVKNGRGKLQ